MPVSRKELREYFEPALRRKAFRFHQLRGLVDDGTLQGLRFAKVFSRPDKSRMMQAFAKSRHSRLADAFEKPDQAALAEAYQRPGMSRGSDRAILRFVGSSGNYPAGPSPRKRNDARDFMRELGKAGPPLKAPILHILGDMMQSAGPSGVPDSVRLDAMAKIHGILLECGVHAVFQRPSSAGLMLHMREADGLPLHLYIGESDGDFSGQGKLNLASGGGGSIEIDITQNAARLMQGLDYWLSGMRSPGRHLDDFMLRLALLPRKKMHEYAPRLLERASMSGSEIPVLFALDLSCTRLMMERFDSIAADSRSPRGFLMRALNTQIDSTLAHEIAHLEEHRATGSVPVHPMVREAFAYFLQAIYADPADAFSSMLSRGFDISRLMPSFDSALRALGPHVFHMEGGYLRGWARGMLDAMFDHCEKTGSISRRPDPEPIKLAQTSDYITERDMPYVERALCNPNRRTHGADMALSNAEPQ